MTSVGQPRAILPVPLGFRIDNSLHEVYLQGFPGIVHICGAWRLGMARGVASQHALHFPRPIRRVFLLAGKFGFFLALLIDQPLELRSANPVVPAVSECPMKDTLFNMAARDMPCLQPGLQLKSIFQYLAHT